MRDEWHFNNLNKRKKYEIFMSHSNKSREGENIEHQTNDLSKLLS